MILTVPALFIALFSVNTFVVSVYVIDTLLDWSVRVDVGVAPVKLEGVQAYVQPVLLLALNVIVEPHS